MPLPFEFVVGGSPVSRQARRRNRVREWMLEVETVAKRHWDVEPPYGGEVMVAITYVFEDTLFDVDNIPKPILDALSGLVYSDDAQVTDLLCRKRRLGGDLRIENPSPMLLATLGDSEQFFHVVVTDALSREVAPW